MARWLPLLVPAAAACHRAEPPAPRRELPPAVVAAPARARPPPPPAAPALPKPIRILVGGDLIPHRPSLASPAAITAALLPLADTFHGADAVVANYEAATGELEKKAFRLAYAAPPAWLAALPNAGITAVSVANNHACDLDYDGVEATLTAASDGGVVALGGDERGDPWQPRVIAERDGKKICAIAWTTLVNASGGCAKTVRLAIAPENAVGRLRVATAIQRARATCDATIAIIHGGVEYAPQTSSMMVVAQQAADAGADAVIVHHPHIASPVRVHSTKDGRHVPIFASVGNLVSNQGESWKPTMFPVMRENRRLVCVNGWTRLGVLADLQFDLSDGPPKLAWGYHLLWTDNEHADDHANKSPKIVTRLIDPHTDTDVLAQLAEDEDGPVGLFADACWMKSGDAPNQDARCTTGLTHETRRIARRKP